jgi:hypothetical protein
MTLTDKRTALFILIPMVFGLFVAIGLWFPIGSDYYLFYRAKPLELFAGTANLYDGTGVNYGLPPWTVPVFGLTALLPLKFGQAVVITITLAALIVACLAFKHDDETLPPVYLVLVVVNVHTFDLILRANIDGFALMGLALTWLGYKRERPLLIGVGFWLISFKPIHLMLYSLLVLWGIRSWSWRSWVWVITPLGLSIMASTAFLGPAWLIEFVHYNAVTKSPFVELQTSLWRLTDIAGLPSGSAMVLTGIAFAIGLGFIVTRRQVNRWAAILMLTLNSFFSPYSMGYHYVVHAPVLYTLMLRDRRFAFMWLLTLIPLLRLTPYYHPWMDSLYVLGLLISAVYVYWHSPEPEQAEPQPEALPQT